ncbi:hypothetical protein HA402_007739 [Bradysia odoriphaga]|nr:hypothetical protein HA402_007739 [Bradysia odoriphaga]
MLKDIVAERSTDTSTSDHKCGGCGSLIKDRFYLSIGDSAWHGTCLRCCRCSQPLDEEITCFCKEGNIYCKDDYYRLFSRRCGRCGAGLCSSELVMRARELVFHISCFSCILCGAQLSTGDTAAIRGGRVFCGEHYDTDILSESNSVQAFFPTSPQKGRPRKRKPTSQSDPIDNRSTLRIDIQHTDLPLSSLDLSYDGSQSPGSSNLSSQSRSKRMRTSFKHHQLRTMKSYFAINQNPDAKDLKQLAQKTGLSKRVLQVWFQNARAKWRRNVMRQDGVTGNSQITGNLTPITSGGPPSVQSSTSSTIESGMTPSHALEEMHHMTFAEMY